MTTTETQRALENLRGKHIKQLLTKLEKVGIVNYEVRKIILDEMNDYCREIFEELGYTLPE